MDGAHNPTNELGSEEHIANRPTSTTTTTASTTISHESVCVRVFVFISPNFAAASYDAICCDVTTSLDGHHPLRRLCPLVMMKNRKKAILQ
jgi:hypothetical protein